MVHRGGKDVISEIGCTICIATLVKCVDERPKLVSYRIKKIGFKNNWQTNNNNNTRLPCPYNKYDLRLAQVSLKSKSNLCLT